MTKPSPQRNGPITAGAPPKRVQALGAQSTPVSQGSAPVMCLSLGTFPGANGSSSQGHCEDQRKHTGIPRQRALPEAPRSSVTTARQGGAVTASILQLRKLEQRSDMTYPRGRAEHAAVPSLDLCPPGLCSSPGHTTCPLHPTLPVAPCFVIGNLCDFPNSPRALHMMLMPSVPMKSSC